jgi:hypothetical protein
MLWPQPSLEYCWAGQGTQPEPGSVSQGFRLDVISIIHLELLLHILPGLFVPDPPGVLLQVPLEVVWPRLHSAGLGLPQLVT